MTSGRSPVVVVGAGPVGCAVALLLAARGIETVVLERHANPYPLPRAVHLDDEVYAVLADLGVAEEFGAVSRPMPGMRLLDARHHTLAEFRRDTATGPLGWPQASMFDQPDLERILLQRLADEPLASLHREHLVTRVEARDGEAVVEHVDARGRPHRTVAAAVLGCDGANSITRAAVGARMTDLHFRERWLVIDLRLPERLHAWGGVHQICDPRRPATFMHVTGTRYRWEFRLRPGDDEARMTTQEGVAALVAPWFGPTLPPGTDIVRHASYTFRATVADRWRSGRVFLLGDAAHQTPPFIGQGLGAGLRDAHNLGWKLAGFLRGELDEAVLATYEAERRPHAVRTVRSAVAMGWALTGGQDGAAVARRTALTLLCRIPGFTRAVLNGASPALGPSTLVRTCLRYREVGRPSPVVLTRTPASRGFCVLTPTPPAAVDTDRFERLGVTVLVTGDASGRSALVRPDGAVAATATGSAAVARPAGVVEDVTDHRATVRQLRPAVSA